MDKRAKTGQGSSTLYRRASLVLALLFASVGLIFLFWPGRTISFFNLISKPLGFKPVPESAFPFFPVIAVAYMYLVTVLAWLMFRNPREKKYPLLLAQAKGASALLSFGFLIFERTYLIYLVNGVVDGVICLLALYFYAELRARLRAGSSEKAGA